MTLFKRDSAVDLLCRGFGREEILTRTGEDVGHNGNAKKLEIRGVDRDEYKFAFVVANVPRTDFVAALDRYGDKTWTRGEVFAACGLAPSVRVSLETLSARMGCASEFEAARAREVEARDAVRRRTNRAKFGVEYPTELPEVVARVRETTTRRHGGLGMASAEIRFKVERAMAERHGSVAAAKTAAREKARRTRAERAASVPPRPKRERHYVPVRDVETWTSARGLFDADSARDLFCRGFSGAEILARTGVECGYNGVKLGVAISKSDRVEYAARVVRERVGLDAFRAVMTETSDRGEILSRVGLGSGCRFSLSRLCDALGLAAEYEAVRAASYASRTRVIQDTMMARYGVRGSAASPELEAKRIATMIDKYDVKYSQQSAQAREKTRLTTLVHFGVEYSLQNADLRAKAAATTKKRFGVEHAAQCPDVMRRMVNTKRVNGTFNTSEAEAVLREMLVAKFGESDVKCQHETLAYPYQCDFYVASRDLYVELNGFVSHGRHWFGQTAADLIQAAALSDRHTEFYDNVVDVWTRRDVEKRETARRNNLNYVVFWDLKLSDAELWFALGCPDGRDWEREYSWLPDPSVPLVYDGDFPETLELGLVRLNRAVKAAVWPEFYKREVALWGENYDGKWGTVQARLYANRFKYLGKLPDELTGREILRGLGISGMVDSHSTFDAFGMLEFLDAYRPESVYDPCAGWGERLAVCAVRGIEYFGVDVNPGVVEGHERLIRRYGLTGVSTRVGDSGVLDFSNKTHDCVFTCPPYGSREIYTDAGAENLDPAAFDDWWRRVVANATGPRTRVFAYQIDAAHRDGMNAALVDAGWHLDREIPVGRERVSHMGRARGATSKRNYEAVQVFVR